MLYDGHGRLVNYLRLAVTDRCNLRCYYCMPEHGLNWLSRTALMSYEELMRTCSLLVKAGIEKIRITGGEPFVRKDMMQFLTTLSKLQGLNTLTLTTNGVLTAPLVPELKKIGIQSVNLSLDTLDRNRFHTITYRDELPSVLETLEQLLKYNIEVKINAVVMADKNIQDIVPLVALTKELPLSVRFIEEMPFNGKGNYDQHIHWDHVRILNHIEEHFGSIAKIPDPPYSTSYNYHIAGHKGSIGIIAAYTRSFCGACNRIRITPEGSLKTCLYDGGGLNIKDMLRQGKNDAYIQTAIFNALGQKASDGWEAEKNRTEKEMAFQSMAAIGG